MSDENKGPTKWDHQAGYVEIVRRQAEIYKSRGWAIVREKIQVKGGKPTGVPLGKIGRTYNEAFNDPRQFQEGENIGILTGERSNVSVLDIDNKPLRTDLINATSTDVFTAMIAYFGKTDDETKVFADQIAVSNTGGGGLHIFLNYMENVKNKIAFPELRINVIPEPAEGNPLDVIKLDWDFKNDGGKITMPPSIHKSGTAYKWTAKTDRVGFKQLDPPQWLLRVIYGAPIVMTMCLGKDDYEIQGFEVLDIPERTQEENLNNGDDFSECKMENLPATAEEFKEVVNAIPDNMADHYEDWTKVIWAIKWTANACAYLKHPEINNEFGLNLADEFSKKSRKYAGRGDVIAKWHEERKGLLKYASLLYWAKKGNYVIKSNLTFNTLLNHVRDQQQPAEQADQQQPAEQADQQQQQPAPEHQQPAEQAEQAALIQNIVGDKKIAAALVSAIFKGNDDDYAEYVEAKYKNRFITFNSNVYEFVENSNIWKMGTDDIFHSFLGKQVFGEIDNAVFALMKDRNKISEEKYKFLAMRRKKVEGKLRNNGKRVGIVKCLMAIFNRSKNPFDINPHLIGFNNGIYDLKQGEFRKGKPDDYVSLSVGYDYSPLNDTSMNELNEILKKIMPYEDTLTYLLQVLSTGLFGQQIQNFFILTGAGGNGKDTLITKLYRWTIGEYYVNAHINIITKEAKESDLNQGLANLHNKRACVYVEPNAKNNLIGSAIKTLTGTDVITARGLYEKQTEKRNAGTYILLTNDIPRIDSLDGGVARRLRVINFPTLFKRKEEMAGMADLTNIHEANPYYETMDFVNKYKMSLFHILSASFTTFKNNGYKFMDTPARILNDSSFYLRNCDDLLMWFYELYEKGDENEFIQIADVSDEFKRGDLYANMSKKDRRIHNKKYIMDKIKTHPELRGYCKESHRPTIEGVRKQYRNVIMGYRRKNYDDNADNDDE